MAKDAFKIGGSLLGGGGSSSQQQQQRKQRRQVIHPSQMPQFREPVRPQSPFRMEQKTRA